VWLSASSSRSSSAAMICVFSSTSASFALPVVALVIVLTYQSPVNVTPAIEISSDGRSSELSMLRATSSASARYARQYSS